MPGRSPSRSRALPYEAVGGGLPGGACEPSGFAHEVDMEFVDAELQRVEEDRGLAKVTVTVRWDGGDSYSATGVVSRW